jgi:putative hydrolase of the HAD superfamily
LTQSAETHPEVDIYKVFDDFMHKYGHRRYSQQIILDTILLFRSLTVRQFGVFPGVYDVLITLSKRYKIGIISDAQWPFYESEIFKLELDRFFKHRILSSRYGFKKTDPRMFTIAMERLKIGPKESVYIGDNPPKDLIGVKNAGIKFILFRSECKSLDGFQPDACFNDYSQLESILKKSAITKGTANIP